MSKNKKNLHKEPIGQKDLFFDHVIVPGMLDLSMAFRDRLSKALRDCKFSRWETAAKISELTKHNISKDMLDKVTSGNPCYGLRAEDLTAFCFVTGSLDPFQELLNPLGCEIFNPKESARLRLYLLERKKMKLQAEIENITHELETSEREK